MHRVSPEPAGWSLRRGVITYLVTSGLLASAWHSTFEYGLWIVNALAGTLGVVLGLHAMGSSWRAQLRWSSKQALVGAALGIALVAATQLSARLLLPLMPPVLTETRRLYDLLQGTLRPSQYATVLALVAVAEELVFRGVVTSLCELRFTPIKTLLLTTTLYVLPLAASGSWLLVAIGLTLGATWTIARLWSKSLLIPLVAHIIWAEMVFVAMPVG